MFCLLTVRQQTQRSLRPSLRHASGAGRHYCSSESGAVPEIDVQFSNRRTLRLATGKYARFADGTATATMGDTTVLVTAVAKPKPGPQPNFMPLMVDYRQKSAAASRIPTNFLRRELGPSEKEILCGRLVDRSVRCLFPDAFKCETQLVCNQLAVDATNLPDVLAINAASAALSLSDIPWNGPVGAVRVGLCDGEVIVQPTRRELQSSELDLVVTATKQNLVVMLEGRGNIVLQQDLLKAIKQGTREAQHIIAGIERVQRSHGKAKRALDAPVAAAPTAEIVEAMRSMGEMRLREVFRDVAHDKLSRDQAVNAIRTDCVDRVWSSYASETDPAQLQEVFGRLCRQIFRDAIFEEERRCDGRDLEALRRIECEVNLHRPLHGSAFFQRGQTQVLCTATLDSPESAMRLDAATAADTGLKAKNFFLHYEFPPYATGEIGRIGPIGRREMGHGALAERGLLPIIPADYPFAIRLTSEVLESNGSSSMASVCGGSLALMDAGVPVLAPAAGVAIGLVTRFENADTKHMQDYRILTDILGIEDYMGDMDMKVAGTRRGFTAIQADIKIPGLPLKIVMEALQRATDAKGRILDIMDACLPAARRARKDCWPVTDRLTVEPHQRTRLIGPGGLTLRRIAAETGVQLRPLEDDGGNAFAMFAPSAEAMAEAKESIAGLLSASDARAPELEFGGIYTARIVELKDIGVMLTLYAAMPPALLHNSQLDQRKVAHPSALGLKVDDEIQVKYFGRDPVSGFMRLSRKVLQGPATTVLRNLDKSAAASTDTPAASSSSSSSS